MIIKKLKLENIRSYKNQLIDFSLGKTLFEGDIGSGKSTILMAIEFGLFGLGSEKAGSLLRAGEKDGFVGVFFESGGKEYVVNRHLVKKGNSINQDDCKLKSPDEGTKSYSVTELKEKILEILGFNEPIDPKAQSFIYRYAIYTPQEEMKAILTLRPDIRLQTLRKAFRMEEYKTSAENAKNLSNEIKSRGKELAAMASEVQAMKAKIDQLKASTALKKNELENLNLERNQVDELIHTQKVKRDDLRSKQLVLKAETGKADALLALVAEKEKEIKDAQAQLASNRARIKLVQPKIVEMSNLANPSELAQIELKEEIQHLEEELKKLRNLETQIRVKFSDYKTILDKGVCPTCDQPIDPHGFSDLVLHKETELKATQDNVEGCNEKLQISKTVLDKKVQFDMAQARLEDAKKSLSEYEENVRIWLSKFEEADGALKTANMEMVSVKASIQKLQGVNADLQNVEIRITKSEEDLKRIDKSISSAEANIVDWERQTKDYKDSIEKKLEKKASSDKLNEYLIWVQDYFLPTLELVEKQVMLNHNQEFNAQFQKWFGMLVDDPGKLAKVDEEFTPVIQQDGLDQEVSYLSGGEKTSVALAYRLALNSVVRKESSGLESNLLILDEPTDGFSKEQLSKVREILDEIQSPQIILVSHERELESFADQVIKVSKANGESSISIVN